MIPTLLKPRWWSARNRWAHQWHISAHAGRDAVVLFLSLIVMFGIFQGTTASLTHLHEHRSLLYLHPELPLGSILTLLWVMLVFTNGVAALGSLYLSHDLDMLVSSPVSTARFFWGRLIDIAIHSGWMAAVFGLPTLYAFGSWHEASVDYYLIALAVFPPYFLLPAAVAMCAVTVLAAAIPARRTKEVLLLLCAASLIGIYMLVRLVTPVSSSMSDIEAVMELAKYLHVPGAPWIPSYWTTVPLAESLEPTGRSIVPFIGALYSVTIFFLAISYIAFRVFYHFGYSRSLDMGNRVALRGTSLSHIFSLVFFFVPPPMRALWAKEFRLFARDVTQAAQLILLLGLCLVYLYNFQAIGALGEQSDIASEWRIGLMTVMNTAMGAFVVTAVCTRFVFPSVSLEGRSFWLVQAAPLSSKQYLWSKLLGWFLPIGIMSSVILGAGSLAIDAPVRLVLVTCIASWIIAFGLVGLALGLGAYYSHFEWEHSSQLAASLGSLVYMVSSIILILFTIAPIAILVFLRVLRMQGYDFTPLRWYAIVGSCAAFFVYINYAVARWAMHIGEGSLEPK